MDRRYTINELADILQITYNSARRKVQKYGLKTHEELVNNRRITVVELNDKKLEEMKETTDHYKNKQQQDNNTLTTHEEHVIEAVEFNNTRLNDEYVKVDFVNHVFNELKTYSNQVTELVKSEAESRTKLLLIEDQHKSNESLLKQKEQDVEFYKNKYFELKHQLEEYSKQSSDKEKQINELQQQLEIVSNQNIFTMPFGEVIKKL